MDKDLESIQQARTLLAQAQAAQARATDMTQEEIDRIVHSMAQAAMRESGRLAQMASDETGYGKVEDKLTKNMFAARDVYESIKDKKTAGIISRDDKKKVWEIAEPVGIVAGIIPSTNPTSTVIFKALIAVKARNAIVFSPHPAAANCTKEAAEVVKRAAEQAGAPEGLISCLAIPSVAGANELMTHALTDLILATGGSDMVRAAYSSGKPAYGVGPGNVPVYIHSSAQIRQAVADIIRSKTFDYGTICASEQALVVERSIRRKFKSELESQGAYFLDDYEKKRVGSIILSGGRLNPRIVGQSPQKLAEMAGIAIPDDCKVLVAEEENIGKEYPFSLEKLSPILAFYTADDWQEAMDISRRLLKMGGLGHTFGIHSEDPQIVEKVALSQETFRIVVNSGTTFGGIGATTEIMPSMTLGCGTLGNNITSDNITVDHLMNIKRVAYGVRKLEMETPSANYQQPVSVGTQQQASVSRDEIIDIVKAVMQELKL
ncbi:acetaldehyde dehydrogenase (acetylating) [Sporosarcina sp. FSL W7-1349]|uniref:acetaldehyde dehydrogenase (acetylating) n=1 Tax=Sporosarcina sp. FSL W7-1349 TaxID=2921561 RepID=UPI0030FA744D